jgi:hypothetical protein
MTRQQRIIVIVLGALSLTTILLLCGVVFFSMSQLGQQAAQSVSTPTYTPTVTPIPTWTPTPTPPIDVGVVTPTLWPLKEEEAAILDQVGREVAELRGLEPLYPVPRWKISRMQLRQRYADVFVNDEWEEAVRSLVIVYAAFDFMPSNTDLMALWRDDFADWIAGFYMVDVKEIYIVSDAYAIGATERAIFAHEYDHALQDQHFDLQSLGLYVTSEPEYSDRLMAMQALVEGDAELTQELYIDRYFSEEDALDMLNEALKRSYVWKDSPRVLGQMSIFPYEQGKEFVGALFVEGGWQKVNDAYANLPASTEHILHPDRYLAGDQPVPVSLPPLTDTLSGDWRIVYDNTAGEFLLRLYLENRLPEDDAMAAAKGWGGDHCVVYYNDATGDTLMLLTVVWDTSADAREFRDAYTRYAEARFGHDANRVAEGVSCWQGLEVLCLAGEGDRAVVVLGPDQPTVDAVLTAISE